REDEGTDPAAHVPDPDPGGDRRQGDRARDRTRAAQGRDPGVLGRRDNRQKKVSGEAEGRQEEDAAVWQGRHPAGSLYRRAEGGQLRLLAPSFRDARSTTPESRDSGLTDKMIALRRDRVRRIIGHIDTKTS